MKDYSALLDHMTKKTPQSKTQIIDGLNLVREPIPSLEATYHPQGTKRPKIGAITSVDMEQSARNTDQMEEVEKDGEVDDWVPPSD